MLSVRVTMLCPEVMEAYKWDMINDKDPISLGRESLSKRRDYS